MPQLTRLALCLLAACTAPQPQPVVFRDATAPIYSAAAFDPARLTGHWVQVAGFAPQGHAPCGPGAVDFGVQVVWDLCLASGETRGAAALNAAKPARFDLAGLPVWWVLWADADDRTLVIGTPSGTLGFILNRAAAIPADRLKAARDILRFNGYDLDTLVVF